MPVTLVHVDGEDGRSSGVGVPVGVPSHPAPDIHHALSGEAREARRAEPSLELPLGFREDLGVARPFVTEPIRRSSVILVAHVSCLRGTPHTAQPCFSGPGSKPARDAIVYAVLSCDSKYVRTITSARIPVPRN